jgi:hypothetical protein
LGKTIAEGNGTIYAIQGQPDKVVKIVYSYRQSYTDKMMRLFRSLNRLKSPAVVRVHRYGKFKVSRQSYYYYVMDKLRPLAGNIWYTGDLIEEYVHGGPMPANESGRIKSFVRKARKLGRRHSYNDVHGGNVMKTKRGAFKFVDLESFTY